MFTTKGTKVVLGVVLGLLALAGAGTRAATQALPDRLSDQEFWRLSAEFSEPNGYFQSDNLVSNERFFQHVVPTLRKQKGRGAYLGVAPDQNFTFIAALDPKIAFIVDIRRGNLHEQLMYKALFELSADRADFYGRLFSRKRPESLGTLSTAQEMVAAFAAAPPSDLLYRDNLKAVLDHLTKKHGFPLGEEDLRGIEYVYGQFFTFGPDITYQSSSRPRSPVPPASRSFLGRGGMPSYAELQVATDVEGRNNGYLASEEIFRFVKAFEARNLLVPVVGDFAGPKALRAVGQYLSSHGATVTGFYVSNVEQYLFQNQVWQEFYRNVATLPLDDGSVFIRSIGGMETLDPIKLLLKDVADNRIHDYVDLFADETGDKPALMRRVMFGMLGILVLAVLWFAPPWSSSLPVEAQGSAGPVPAKLTDQQFWSLSNQLSEPNGFFRSENLVSNEHTFQYVIPTLERRVRGGVYVGVAPDQNFTYISVIKPRIAFIVDIRRGNLLQHLMYKAIFELSADRAAFVSRLFSKPRPKGLGPESSVEAIFEAFGRVDTSEALYKANVKEIADVLLKRHGFKLSPDDMQQLEGIYWHFYWEGPSLRYTMSAPVPNGSNARGFGFGSRGMNFPSYEEQVEQADWEGRSRSYLATEEAFAYIKGFEEKNLIVPVVGNFSGPKALRSVGKYAREHNEVVSAFYVSNVEQYLFQDNIWTDFYQNVATLPVDDTSTFIRSVSARMGYNGPMQWRDGRATALDPIKASVRDFRAGKLRRYYDLNARWQ